MVTIDTISRLQGQRRRNFSTHGRHVRVLLRRLMDFVTWLIERRETRLRLLELTDDQLKDIGISRADAYREGSRRLFDTLPAGLDTSWRGL